MTENSAIRIRLAPRGLFIDAVGMRHFGTKQPIDQIIGSVGLIITRDFVELLTGITHDLEGFADIGQFRSQL